MRDALAVNTLRAYRADWEHFVTWCSAQRRDAIPAAPGTVAAYLIDLAAHAKMATVARRLAAISKMHKAAGYPSPMKVQHANVKETLSRIRREKGTAPMGKAALLTADLRRLVGVLPETVLGARDAALLLTGFASGFRRSELAVLRVEDVEITQGGLKIVMRRLHTDQGRTGRLVEIPRGIHAETCPVRTYARWLEVLGITITSIMKQTGHKSVASCRRYIRDAQLFGENAASRLGL